MPGKVIFLISIVVCLLLSIPLAADTHKKVADQMRLPVEKFKLDNGLVVLLYEDHSAPLVRILQCYRVGSRNEKPGRTGLAHFFEHFMFKGTPKYPNFELILQKNGGSHNAFTSHDSTCYYEDVTNGMEELILDIESDRMKNLIFRQEDIKSEREVVKEERRLTVENNITGPLSKAMFASVFKVHSYKWPMTGSMKDLNAASIEDMREFYRAYYTPNNAILVIGGDISASQIKKLVKKYYAHIPASPLPDHQIPEEPAQKNQRQVTLRRNVQSVTITYAYKIPPDGSDGSYAIDLLSFILTSGESSRLHRALVRKSKLATTVSSSAYALKDPGVFRVSVFMKPQKNVKRAKEIVLRELKRFRNSLVTDSELEKSKNHVMLAHVHSLIGIRGKVMALSHNELLYGDYRRMFQHIDKYQSVTKEQILHVAQKYLNLHQSSFIQVIGK